MPMASLFKIEKNNCHCWESNLEPPILKYNINHHAVYNYNTLATAGFEVVLFNYYVYAAAL